MGLWKNYVHRPERDLWHDYEWGHVHWYCCGNPLEARALLDTVMHAISPQSAHELRKAVGRSDAVWNLQPRPMTRTVDKEQAEAERYSARSWAGSRASERKLPTQVTAGSTSTGPKAPAYWSGYSRGGGIRCTGVPGKVCSAERNTRSGGR